MESFTITLKKAVYPVNQEKKIIPIVLKHIASIIFIFLVQCDEK